MSDIVVEYDAMQCMSKPSKQVIEARRRRMKERVERGKAEMKGRGAPLAPAEEDDSIQVITTDRRQSGYH